jgi:hypothetical protein
LTPGKVAPCERTGASKQGKDDLYRLEDEFIARFAQAPSKWDHAIQHMLHKFGALQNTNHALCEQKYIPFHNGERPNGRRHLATDGKVE